MWWHAGCCLADCWHAGRCLADCWHASRWLAGHQGSRSNCSYKDLFCWLARWPVHSMLTRWPVGTLAGDTLATKILVGIGGTLVTKVSSNHGWHASRWHAGQKVSFYVARWFGGMLAVRFLPLMARRPVARWPQGFSAVDTQTGGTLAGGLLATWDLSFVGMLASGTLATKSLVKSWVARWPLAHRPLSTCLCVYPLLFCCCCTLIGCIFLVVALSIVAFLSIALFWSCSDSSTWLGVLLKSHLSKSYADERLLSFYQVLPDPAQLSGILPVARSRVYS